MEARENRLWQIGGLVAIAVMLGIASCSIAVQHDSLGAAVRDNEGALRLYAIVATMNDDDKLRMRPMLLARLDRPTRESVKVIVDWNDLGQPNRRARPVDRGPTDIIGGKRRLDTPEVPEW